MKAKHRKLTMSEPGKKLTATFLLSFLTFSIGNHPHLQFPHQLNWFQCFLNGPSHWMRTRALHALARISVSPKFTPPWDLQCNIVYKIPCKDCPWNYIGETGRFFQTWKKEYQQNFKNYSKGSNVANHPWKNNHFVDFDNICVIDKGKKNTRILANSQNCRHEK